MPVLLPPSEGKASSPRRGKSLDLDALTWPELSHRRGEVIDSLTALANGDPAVARATLGLSARMDSEIARDRRLRQAPTMRAQDLYTGVLYQGLDAPGLDSSGRRWANRHLVIVSALFGVLRLPDRVPTYRLGICTRLPGIGALGPFWRRELGHVLPAAAGKDLIVDLRSTDYAATWRPTGELAARTVSVHVKRDGAVASHDAKHTRGLVARRLCIAGERLRRPEQLVDVLADEFTVTLDRTGPSWRLEVLL